ncbi:MAG: leucine--tRNA ligase [Aeriscardovia sp.]|nr:leucine--tRNA ligase [Aeriscardovia sp.]MBO5633206.1 leucine--tRNA ligase [Aeriscardovia sp.]
MSDETKKPKEQYTAEPQWRYNAALAQDIELKWQKEWDDTGAFYAANVKGNLVNGKGDHAGTQKPYFAIDMFPFPSGKGLHVGHPLGYIATDMMSRYHRMKGENVLHAIAFDAFGLPAEQYAVQTGQHPRITTEENIANMRRQLHRMGLSFDSRRSFATTDMNYVRWTQWIFSQIYNSWYDPTFTRPDGGQGSARPISTLIDQFTNGTRSIPGHAGAQWSDLTAREQEDVLNDFRLAYISKAPVNWAPGLGTVLANEEVTADGRSERGNFPVFKRQLRQWSMRITAYGHRLIEDLETVDWPDKVKAMQRNWIGESHGAAIHFDVDRVADGLDIYTTRPDTIFGTTFMVISPEHPLCEKAPEEWPIGVPEQWTGGYDSPLEAVRAYRQADEAKSAADHVSDGQTKSGVFTGLYAINPVTGQQLPIFTADYVLMDYGFGAIMAVPGGDQRDYDFATTFGLPIVYTVLPQGVIVDDLDGSQPMVTKVGTVINSATESTAHGQQPLSLNGQSVADATSTVITWLEEEQIGHGVTSYRLRDWLFSRQRYWGEPFPIVYDEDEVPHLLPADMLPVRLPDVPDYTPKTFDPDDASSNPEAPLSRNTEWTTVQLDLGDGLKTYHRETNTMPNWAGSCWYYLRYLDPQDDTYCVDPSEEAYWMGPDHNATAGKSGGVDLYIGGVEHAVLHLLYARFWHKVLFDLGYVSSSEPFHKLFNQGYVQAYAYTDSRGQYVPAAEVTETVEGSHHQFEWNGEMVNREFGKMGKSLKNIVTPDDMYEEYGADTFRLYEMSMGPLAESRPWNTKDVTGSLRFLQRLWRNCIDEQTGLSTVTDEDPDLKTLKLLNKTIAEVTDEMEGMRPNTAIAKLIVLNNHLTSLPAVPRAAVEPLILMVAPIAPHIAEELWNRLGHDESLAHADWPVADPQYLGADLVTAVIQVKGKVRAKLEVPSDITEEDLRDRALQAEGIEKWIGTLPPRKVIVKAPKIVSIVPSE